MISSTVDDIAQVMATLPHVISRSEGPVHTTPQVIPRAWWKRTDFLHHDVRGQVQTCTFFENIRACGLLFGLEHVSKPNLMSKVTWHCPILYTIFSGEIFLLLTENFPFSTKMYERFQSNFSPHLTYAAQILIRLAADFIYIMASSSSNPRRFASS